jgi:uncharacterized spore protein YtfJ
MANENFLEQLSNGLGQSASIRNIFGEAIQVHNKTIIPVGKIAFGFGGGFGQGRRKHLAENRLQQDAADNNTGEGAGGGGGLSASAKGVFEITPTSVRFIPAYPAGYLFAGMVAGFLLKMLLFPRKR